MGSKANVQPGINISPLRVMIELLSYTGQFLYKLHCCKKIRELQRAAQPLFFLRPDYMH
jgi:hypothetical protein